MTLPTDVHTPTNNVHRDIYLPFISYGSQPIHEIKFF